MRVAIDAVGIRFGGAMTALEDMIEFLPRVRPMWEIRIFVLPENLRSAILRRERRLVTVQESPCGDTWIGRVMWQNAVLPSYLRKAGMDVVFSMVNTGAIWPPIAQVILVHQANAFRGGLMRALCKPNRLRFWSIGWLAGISGRRSRRVLVQTEAMKSAVTRRYPRLAEKVVVIPSGVRDVEDSPASIARIRHCFGEQTGPVVSYVSLPYAHKNHVRLLAAWLLVRKVIPGARLALTLGGNVAVPGGRLTETGASVACHSDNLPPGVIDLGFLSRPDVRSLYRCSDVMVFPSLSESFGLPILEAMREGCPVAASDLPYARELLGDSGTYFDPRSESSIANAIIELVGDQSRREQMSLLGRKRSGLYDLDAVTERVAAVLEQAVASGRKAGPVCQ